MFQFLKNSSIPDMLRLKDNWVLNAGLCSWVFYLILSIASAQTHSIGLKLYPTNDTLAIGRPLEVTLYVTNVPTKGILEFPDSITDISPFEIIGAPTISQNNKGLKLIYLVRSFGIEPIQKLSLPVIYRLGKDTVQVWARSSPLRLKQRVLVLQDSLSYLLEDQLIPITPSIDYRLFIVSIFASILFFIILFWIIKRPYLKWVKKKQLKREWILLRNQLEKAPDPAKYPGDFLLHLIRNSTPYFPKVDGIELSSLTTPELENYLPQIALADESFKPLLQQLYQLRDQVIFAGHSAVLPTSDYLLEPLLSALQAEYYRKREAII